MIEDALPVDKIIQGDTLQVLKTFPDDCIDCIVTSPPYWGLRDYGEQTNTVWDGDPNCEHEWDTKEYNITGGMIGLNERLQKENSNINSKFVKEEFNRPSVIKSGFCKKCGAWYGQLGLEPTLDLYLEHMLQITSELKRVLKPTGVMFWNHSDCYGGTGFKGDYRDPKYPEGRNSIEPPNKKSTPKCMALQNYRLVLRMIDEQGWILRNVIIWHKPNHMPSSVKDRFTNAYEPVFMLTKSKRYFFDLDAVRVPLKNPKDMEYRVKLRANKKYNHNPQGSYYYPPANLEKSLKLGKNPGDLWTIPTQPFPEAHFATFPEKLVEPMIKAGCPEWICKKCGKARERITKTEYIPHSSYNGIYKKGFAGRTKSGFKNVSFAEHKTIGWSDCGCNAGWKPGIVLDPFAGSGTTLYTARKLNRHYIGIELNPEYIKMAKKRLSKFGARLEEYDNGGDKIC